MGYNSISDFLKKYGFKNIAEAKLNSNDLKFINQHHFTLSKIIDTVLSQQNIMVKSVVVKEVSNDIKTLPQPDKLKELLKYNPKKELPPKIIKREPKELKEPRKVVSINDELTFNEWLKEPKIIDKDKPTLIKTRKSKTRIKRLSKHTDNKNIIKSTSTKTCNDCKETKSFDDFYNVKSQKDGKDGKCKSCRNQYLKKYNERKKQIPY